MNDEAHERDVQEHLDRSWASNHVLVAPALLFLGQLLGFTWWISSFSSKVDTRIDYSIDRQRELSSRLDKVDSEGTRAIEPLKQRVDSVDLAQRAQDNKCLDMGRAISALQLELARVEYALQLKDRKP